MVLFEIDRDTTQVRINKPWMLLVPEFAVLIKRDKGESYKVNGKSVRLHVRYMKEFTFIYFYTDFGSPIYDYEDSERLKEAMYYSGIKTEEDLDDKVWAAVTRYEYMMVKGARSLRTYKALLKTMDAMDLYLETINFAAKTKTGELVNSPDKIASTVEKMDKMHTSIENFRKRVDNELKQQGTIRGAATLGDNEDKRTNWSESDIAAQSGEKAGGSHTRTMEELLQRTSLANTVKVDVPEEEQNPAEVSIDEILNDDIE